MVGSGFSWPSTVPCCKREIDFGEGDRRGVGADRFGEHQEQRRRRHAQLHALHVFGLLDLLVGGDHALAVIGERDDLVLGLVLVALGDVAEQLAVAIGLPVIEVAQHERRAGDRERLVDRAGERGAGVDDVDGAEPEPLVDLVFVAELRGREHLDLVAAVGALLDLLGRPQRLGVIGLGDFVDMRPFELGLGPGGTNHNKYCGNKRKTVRQMARPIRHAHLPMWRLF